MGNDTEKLNNSAVLSNALEKKGRERERAGEKISWPSYHREKQQQNNLLKHHLKQEVPIHWNSTYYMVEQLLEQQNAVQDFVDQCKVGKKK